MEKKIKPYFELLEHKADMGVRGFGNTQEEAFEQCAKAMFSIMVGLTDVKAKEKIGIKVSANDIEQLLVAWLNELLSVADVKNMVFCKFKVEKIFEKEGKYFLEGKAEGEKIDAKKHKLLTEVKAATYSGLKVEKKGKMFVAQCIVDV